MTNTLSNGETKDSISTRMMQLLWATNVILISSKLLPLVLVQLRRGKGNDQRKLFVVMTFILWLMLLTTALLILCVVRQTICPQMIITRI